MAKKAIMSVEEKQRLEELEAIIKKDLKGFLRVGMALKEIKETKLYRAQYGTWKEYLKAEWDLTRTYADYQIDAFNVVENLKQKCNHGCTFDDQDQESTFRHGGKESSRNDSHNCGHMSDEAENTPPIILPQNERQARPLTALKPVQQLIAWQKVIKRTEGKPTALAVRKVVEEITGKNIDQGVEELKTEAETKEGIPDDFNEAFTQMADVVAKHRKLGWKGIKRKEALKLINALTSYFD